MKNSFPQKNVRRGADLKPALENNAMVFNSDYIANKLLALRWHCPSVAISSIGKSVMGRPLLAACFGVGERRVLFSASHHANEWITSLILLKFMQELCEKSKENGELYGFPANEILNNATLCFVPLINPDGVDLAVGSLRSGRYFSRAKKIAEAYPAIPFPTGWKANIVGTDLNLQYPAGWEEAKRVKYALGMTKPAPRDFVGGTPLSEPESRALADFTERLSPDTIIALHSQGKVIYWKYADLEPQGSRRLGVKLARASGYELSETPAASGSAGYKDWFIKNFDRPGYTLELGMGENPLPLEQFDKIYADTAPMLTIAAIG